MLDKLLGPDFNANCGGWNSTVPCISFKKDGIQLELDNQTWESNFSGLDDDNIWMFYPSLLFDLSTSSFIFLIKSFISLHFSYSSMDSK